MEEITVWETKDGIRINICDMTDGHLGRAIAFTQRKLNANDFIVYQQGKRQQTAIPVYSDDLKQLTVARLQALMKEQARRERLLALQKAAREFAECVEDDEKLRIALKTFPLILGDTISRLDITGVSHREIERITTSYDNQDDDETYSDYPF